ncbi:recombinase RecX, partial [Streptococcus pneumoniae]|uniref:sigma(X)-activator ComW n=1 Tax=Streptococcus pneumoniae TaxID=1313 RepID=UPI000845F483
MLLKIYEQMAHVYDSIEEEYGPISCDYFDWEHVHFKVLLYYLGRYGIGCRKDCIGYHYRVAYR